MGRQHFCPKTLTCCHGRGNPGLHLGCPGHRLLQPQQQCPLGVSQPLRIILSPRSQLARAVLILSWFCTVFSRPVSSWVCRHFFSLPHFLLLQSRQPTGPPGDGVYIPSHLQSPPTLSVPCRGWGDPSALSPWSLSLFLFCCLPSPGSPSWPVSPSPGSVDTHLCQGPPPAMVTDMLWGP